MRCTCQNRLLLNFDIKNTTNFKLSSSVLASNIRSVCFHCFVFVGLNFKFHFPGTSHSSFSTSKCLKISLPHCVNIGEQNIGQNVPLVTHITPTQVSAASDGSMIRYLSEKSNKEVMANRAFDTLLSTLPCRTCTH